MKIGITIGDPGGIGPEIVLKSLMYFSKYPLYHQHQFVVLSRPDDFVLTCGSRTPEIIKQLKTQLKLTFVGLNQTLPSIPGIPSIEGGLFSVKALEEAVKQFRDSHINALVTAPIDKKSLKLAKIIKVDHTSLLKEMTGVDRVDTIFKTGKMWIYFYSKHIPFKEISSFINRNELIKTIRRFNIYNHWFGLDRGEKPLVVAALNPHGSDGGRFGHEEADILLPAIEVCRREGIRVVGPVPADSVFAQAKEGKYSAVISLYHDQGHIAAKTVDFHRTVSFSPGLPFLRTSVDHGTAMDIAGKNQASETSMIQAVKMAIRYGNRYRHFVHRFSLEAG